MMTELARMTFHEGDEVVLSAGTYQGTLGVFVRLKTDVNWADITERNGRVRSHPVAWMAHIPQAPRLPELPRAHDAAGNRPGGFTI